MLILYIPSFLPISTHKSNIKRKEGIIMASLIKVEQSSYVKDVVDTYASAKVSQYSKYLNLTPTFVTYLAVNQIMSRADTGTGTVNSETGYNSPLRFNKIIGLPVYNIPILSPDIMYDETD